MIDEDLSNNWPNCRKAIVQGIIVTAGLGPTPDLPKHISLMGYRGCVELFPYVSKDMLNSDNKKFFRKYDEGFFDKCVDLSNCNIESTLIHRSRSSRYSDIFYAERFGGQNREEVYLDYVLSDDKSVLTVRMDHDGLSICAPQEELENIEKELVALEIKAKYFSR